MTNPQSPIRIALDALGQRWTLQILWVLRQGPLNFRALQAAAGELSPTTLSRRLAQLRELGVITHKDGEGYRLSVAGQELIPVLMLVDAWAQRNIPQ